MEAINQLRASQHDYLVKKYDRAIGTGCGNKLVDGVDTGEQALIVFVTEKDHGFHKQDTSQLLPRSIDGIPVDVIEVGNLVKHGFTTKARPIVPGYSISHPKVTAGTLGGVFQDATGNVVVLSCNHVLANENNARAGDLIFQPGIADQPLVGTSFNGWAGVPNLPYFATLKDYQVLSTTQKNPQDSAIATVYSTYVSQRMISPNYPNGQPMAGISSPTVGLAVQKFGRTTGQTRGKIIALNSEFTISYDLGPVTFTGCVVTSSMSQGGDSGALLLDGQMNAVALLFAGSDKVSLFNPIAPIVSKYGLKIWSPTTQSQVPFWGLNWDRATYGINTIQFQPNGLLVIQAHANQHAYLETGLASIPQTIGVDVYTGNNGGATWGPGLTMAFPKGALVINVRGNTGYGGSWAGNQVYGIGQTSNNSWYRLQVTLGSTVIGCVQDKRTGIWTTILNVPYSACGGAPTAVRVGKVDVAGGAKDYSDLGPVGTTQYQNLTLNGLFKQSLPNGFRELT